MASVELGSHPPILPAGPRGADDGRGRGARTAWPCSLLRAVPLSVGVLLVAAAWARAAGLPTVQGTMGRDEARLALAARGILEHGVPILPGGFLYTRGLLPAYLEAATFSLFGITDQAARLTDLIFSTLLVLAVYSLGRLAGGHHAGLAAAAIIAFSPPIVLQAREGWLYSTFLFWLVMAVFWQLRNRPGDRLRAGLAAAAALLSHELAVLLIPAAAALDLARIVHAQRSRGRPLARSIDRRGLLQFWGSVLGGVILVGALSLLLRAPTLGGGAVEMREYLRPNLDWRGVLLTLGIVSGWHAWLVPVAALGVPIGARALRPMLVGRGAVMPLVMVVTVILFNSFGLIRRAESRYVLPVLPFLAVAAAVALDRIGPVVVAALAGRQRLGRPRHVVRILLLALLVGSSLDAPRLVSDAEARAVRSTWVQAMTDRAPDDLIVSFAPTLTSHYLGRTDVWLRTDGYSKYVWAGPPPYRDVHSGAVVVRDGRELESLLLGPHQGRVAWVLLAGDPATEASRPMRELVTRIAALAVETRRPPDGRVVLKLQL